MKTTKEMIEVMQHFVNGGEIECAYYINENIWKPANCPNWDWSTTNYRIKTDNRLITIEKWLVCSNEGDYRVIDTSNMHMIKNIVTIKLLDTYDIEI